MQTPRLRSLLLYSALIFGGILSAVGPMPLVVAMDAFPQPRLDGGIPLMQALKARKTTREFASKPLPKPVLADLLWAAYGVNRPQEGKRTAPSAHNRQEIDVYAATKDGLFRYDAIKHALETVTEKDIRAYTGKQKFPAHAPLNLVYVVDFGRMKDVPRDAAVEVAAITTGAIVQNVYLYCASAGLNVVVRGWIDKPALAKAMDLRDNQYILVSQTVGYPP
jgi:SagB-type dehydrogenase family enzyme